MVETSEERKNRLNERYPLYAKNADAINSQPGGEVAEGVGQVLSDIPSDAVDQARTAVDTATKYTGGQWIGDKTNAIQNRLASDSQKRAEIMASEPAQTIAGKAKESALASDIKGVSENMGPFAQQAIAQPSPVSPGVQPNTSVNPETQPEKTWTAQQIKDAIAANISKRSDEIQGQNTQTMARPAITRPAERQNIEQMPYRQLNDGSYQTDSGLNVRFDTSVPQDKAQEFLNYGGPRKPIVTPAKQKIDPLASPEYDPNVSSHENDRRSADWRAKLIASNQAPLTAAQIEHYGAQNTQIGALNALSQQQAENYGSQTKLHQQQAAKAEEQNSLMKIANDPQADPVQRDRASKLLGIKPEHFNIQRPAVDPLGHPINDTVIPLPGGGYGYASSLVNGGQVSRTPTSPNEIKAWEEVKKGKAKPEHFKEIFGYIPAM